MAAQQNAPRRAPGPWSDLELQPLLDHIAIELAEEYVRLMEAAAATETKGADEDDRVAVGGQQ